MRIILLRKFLRSFSYLWIDDNFYKSISLKKPKLHYVDWVNGRPKILWVSSFNILITKSCTWNIFVSRLFYSTSILLQFRKYGSSGFRNDITWRNLRPFYSFLAIIAGWRRGGTASRTLTRGLTLLSLLSFMLTSAPAEEGCWVTWKPQR